VRQRRRAVWKVAAISAALATLVGQGYARQAGTQPPPTFRSGTTIIEVDAIVKDGKGRFVPDLTAADFEVLEDGKPQRVETLFLVRGREVVSAATVAAPESVPVPPVSPIRPVNAPPPAPAPVPRTERVFVLMFDTENIQPGSFDRVKKAAEDFLITSFKDGDVGGVVSNGSMINARLTSSREELLAAVRGLKASGEALAVTREMRREWPRILDAFEAYLIDRMDREAIARAVNRACTDDPGQCSKPQIPVDQVVMEKARRLLPALRALGQRDILTVKALANGLAKVPGRKTIIFMSDGFFTEDSWAALRQVTDMAARASIRIYTLDTRGLDRTADVLEKGGMSGGSGAGDVAGFDTASDGPNSLAADTGGLVIRHENDFGRALLEFADDTSNYYVLGYRPADVTIDGRFRRITVRVKRAGVSVRARQGYMATAERMASGDAAAPPPVSAAPAGAVPVSEAKPGAPAPAPAASTAPPPAAAPPAAAGATATPPAEPLPARPMPNVGERVDALTRVRPDAGPTGADAALRQARAGWDAYQKGDLKGARVALGAAASQPSSPPWVHYALGWSLFAAPDYAAASTAWEHVRKTVPEFEPVYFDLADSYLQQREFGKAVEVLRDAEKRWPKDVEVYNALGVVQLVRGAVDDAVETFNKGVAANPTDASACYNLAKTYEVRYVRGERLRKVGPGSGAGATVLEDRVQAVAYYQRVIALGGPFVDQAREGLKRLGQ
jgi:VWFA-related protein